jgi:hypothetical protein
MGPYKLTPWDMVLLVSNIHLASQEIPCRLRNPKVHVSLPLALTLTSENPLIIPLTHFFKIYLNAILQSMHMRSTTYVPLRIKVKVKLSLCFTNEALRNEGVWWSECTDPHFLDIVEVSCQLHAPAALSPGKDPGLGGPQSRCGRYGEEKISTMPGLELRPLGRLVRRQSLYWLRYPSSRPWGLSTQFFNAFFICPIRPTCSRLKRILLDDIKIVCLFAW